MKPKRTVLCLFLLLTCSLPGALTVVAQSGREPDPVYADKQGVLRWKKNNQEAAFFGVNYTVPFAYGYRSVKARNVDPEKAIDQDVYHLARLGFDAFRVHVWDTEISDTLGNLLENEHLRLFDYLLYKLKERHIKVMLTPIAFWGNGYPERDEHTPGFSHHYGRGRILSDEQAFKAQENYIQQLLRHVNPYTKLTYGDDANIIGGEINNEPRHSGPKARATEYVNRMAAAFRSTGWTKPIFYNISESPRYADAVAKAQVDGFSFQWYPTNLVANRTIQGNYLPHVDRYRIPFDTIPAFRNKPLMVYEFDAGDVMASYSYPAMARSFREAGFGWATQFAYDPMATAYANTEYQTHYLNLAYTPSKAISLLIASETFHKLPLRKNYGAYPTDSVFDAFRVSYKENLSEMNTPQEFYYSNTTRTQPVRPGKLNKVAGVGSSPVISYGGTGTYFLDKLQNGVWRLEVMPDAIHIRDPFAKASPSKEVTRIQWQEHQMLLRLPDLGESFSISGMNEGNSYSAKATAGSFRVKPGTYLLHRKGSGNWNGNSKFGTLLVKEFVAPQPFETTPQVVHQPLQEVSAKRPFSISAQLVGVSPQAKVQLQLNNLSGESKTVEMVKAGAYHYKAEVPAELTTPGQLNYRIFVQDGENHLTFPGGYSGNPRAWDYYHTDTWQTFVAAENGRLELFNPTTDRNLFVYPNLWRPDERTLTATEKSGQLALKLTAKEVPQHQTMGFQVYIGDKLKGRTSELPDFSKMVIRIRTSGAVPARVHVGLLTDYAAAFATEVAAEKEFKDIVIPLSALKSGSFMLLPRPYPGFHFFSRTNNNAGAFSLSQVEKLEVSLHDLGGVASGKQANNFEIEAIWLEKGN